ncbi:MAG TPA: cytochrome c biogenesis protein CcdA, partial [Isosphaeraceae bacterium]
PTEAAPPASASGSPGDDARASAPAGEVDESVKSEVQRASERGLLPFLLVSALGGLIALVMPCVWPMVPITVNFFVKQGQQGTGKTTGLAVTYCLAIIGIFTLVGVLFSACFGAASLQRLANSPWLNFAVAALFLLFGLSLLGLFEVRLPSVLLNASAHGESRGGLVGVIFMALTLTITSFTCTFPVVGGLLVMAAGGDYLYPVIGLATFATVLALPFFLLALAPGLLARMPRSGDWMNAVKVVGGLVEIGAAFKFLNSAEIAYVAPEDAWFNAQALLTIWVVLSLVCGIYLLGLFRTDHDHDAVKVGPGRMLSGTLFLCLALLLAPILFGQEPRSPFVKRLLSGIFPPDFSTLYEGRGGVASGAAPAVQKATASDPRVAIEQEQAFHGVPWGFSYDSALKRARDENRPVLIDFTGVNCANCRLMEQNVLPRSEVVERLKQFVTIQLYTDFVPIRSISADQRQELAEANAERQFDLIRDQSNPSYVVLSPRGEVLATIAGYREPPVFLAFLDGALAKHRDAGPVARADLSAGR